MNRQEFIKHGLTLSGGFFLTHYGLANSPKGKKRTLSLFHTNDIHSRIDPFPKNHYKYGGKGGLIGLNQLYQAEKAKVEHSLLLDCGDIFQGTPYFNFFKGKVEYETMSTMKYDATTLGNHDFDNGIDGLTSTRSFRNFPIINSNYELKDSPLEEIIKRQIIIKKGDLKIGIFGLGIQLEGLVPRANFKGVVYQNPIHSANQMAKQLKKDHKCDIVVCLSHLGYAYKGSKVSDQIIAKNSEHIDVILGGHTHTFLPKPQQFLNAKKRPIIVNQAGWAALQLGQVNLELA